MPIHSYILKYFDEHPDQRISGVKQEIQLYERRPSIFHVEDQILQLDDFKLPIRVYTPEQQEQYSLLVFFHEGRFMNGNIEASDIACRMISSFSGHKIISVDYPVNLDNANNTFQTCYDVTNSIIQQANLFGGNTADISICGGSIGATIATLITIEALKRNEFSFQKQILFYPITAFKEEIEDSEFLSRKMYNGKYGIDLKNINGFCNSNLISPLDTDHSILAKMPNTLIYTAEYDPFSDEGEAFAEKIQTSGGQVKLVRFDGNIHGLMQSFPGSPDYMRGFEITTEFLSNEEKEVLT
ncbi:alpha/beta hydrolase fold domain-containing protein [Ureibacillus manganicus]|uniref:Alpha/beta hydrolase fold-3 domain-containing protein n=1 Tax=Ureibacillus manganicus DSM 26584 TaxID=1384049 RepID=A0A0A3I2B0_9BACL|nr:alpha/beta hydrolase fold domain-containing protein [Ureibacillus manganicus]KGR78829.1 hypothetical protein CD29_09110 [Ureibacillus manganicus DSM 26584]